MVHYCILETLHLDFLCFTLFFSQTSGTCQKCVTSCPGFPTLLTCPAQVSLPHSKAVRAEQFWLWNERKLWGSSWSSSWGSEWQRWWLFRWEQTQRGVSSVSGQCVVSSATVEKPHSLCHCPYCSHSNNGEWFTAQVFDFTAADKNSVGVRSVNYGDTNCQYQK